MIAIGETARVCASYGERARVLIDSVEFDAVVAGALLFSAEGPADLPATGDWVTVRLADPQLALIERVLPRRTVLMRRAAGRRNEEQVLAANADLALLVCGLDGDFNPRRIERYLALCREGGVEPVIALNKLDLRGERERLAAVTEVERCAGGAKVLAISARDGDGCEQIANLLKPGVTAAMLGSSGAGKSTLLNRLLGEGAQRTGPVREHDSRGRHTTTHRELIALPSGAFLIDTPGLREVQLWAGEESISAVFDDIAALSAHCRFADCVHSSEPGCTVRETIDPARLANFHKMRREAERLSGALTEKQRWRGIHKAMRRMQREREKG
ncbi:MAG: ribosome small subunit-dependent GTPase A [Bryobacteraceae bacterium]|nr:ribosome small subunit-dependent GTPase A [Bryobacteraceae bacterium]